MSTFGTPLVQIQSLSLSVKLVRKMNYWSRTSTRTWIRRWECHWLSSRDTCTWGDPVLIGKGKGSKWYTNGVRVEYQGNPTSITITFPHWYNTRLKSDNLVTIGDRIVNISSSICTLWYCLPCPLGFRPPPLFLSKNPTFCGEKKSSQSRWQTGYQTKWIRGKI